MADSTHHHRSNLSPIEFLAVLNDLNGADPLAQSTVYREYFTRLVSLASKRINQRYRSKIEPEEVVQSVFASFIRRNDIGEFHFDDVESLWRLLVTITVRKCLNRIEQYRTTKRAVQRELNQDFSELAVKNFLVSKQPSATELAVFHETLDQLFNQLPERLQQIVCLRLQGASNLEISQELRCSERTVYRSLNQIRAIFDGSSQSASESAEAGAESD